MRSFHQAAAGTLSERRKMQRTAPTLEKDKTDRMTDKGPCREMHPYARGSN